MQRILSMYCTSRNGLSNKYRSDSESESGPIEIFEFKERRLMRALLFGLGEQLN